MTALLALLADADETTLGLGAGAGVFGLALAMLLAYLRGVRFLGPVVGVIQWFRVHGAQTLDLSGLGLSPEAQALVRTRVQGWLRTALTDAISKVLEDLGLLAAFRAKVQKLTAPLEEVTPPKLIEEASKAIRKTTGLMPAFRPAPGTPPELGRARVTLLVGVVALLLALASLVFTPGCVAQEAKHAAERLAATARVIEAAAASHDKMVKLSYEEARAALAGFQALASEHRGYAEDLVEASGGSLEEVARLEAEWRAAAGERARARRAAAAVPR